MNSYIKSIISKEQLILRKKIKEELDNGKRLEFIDALLYLNNLKIDLIIN